MSEALTLALHSEGELRRLLARTDAIAGAHVLSVRSSTPLSEEMMERLPSRTPKVFLWGILGGIGGGLAALLIATLTARAYPMVTGHMPILAAPPVGIVTYEGIALGAVLLTTLGVLWEGRLPRRSAGGEADRRVAVGQIVVALEVPAEARDEVAALGEPLE